MLKPIASLSCDLDDKWTYMKSYGLALGTPLPSYLGAIVPRLLDFLKKRDLTITVFIVGQDAALDHNMEVLRSISDMGHEIGNHSFHHDPWLHLYSDTQIEREIAEADEHIERATGQKPVGFRGPGYSVSIATLRMLARRGYLYDATTLPTFLNPLARAYFLMTAKLGGEESRRREGLFGSFTDGFRPVKPYQWRLDDLKLIEIPVTTMPIVKLPFHVSYILYLAGFSRALALQYFRTALDLCRWTGTEPSLLLHPLDFLGCEDVQDLSFFPGMKLPFQKKIEVVAEVIDLFCQAFTVLTMREHAHRQANRADLPVIELAPSTGSSDAKIFDSPAVGMRASSDTRFERR